MPCDCNKSTSSPLTSAPRVGTMKGGSEAKPSDQKHRRPKGATAHSLKAVLARLHTWARDWSDSQDTASELTAALYDLSVVLKEEHDRLG